MMKHRPFCVLLLGVFLVFSSPLRADDSKVTDWTKQVLLSTLAINYAESEKSIDAMRLNYTVNAWHALSTFLGNYVSIVRKERLTLHPVANGPAKLTDSGVVHKGNFFNGVHYWRINQSVTIPELNINIDFSLFVVKLYPKRDKYLIQSINMVKSKG